MYLLGINIGRNTCAALIKDGDLVSAAEEERFIREKGTSRFPLNAIRFCLEREGITLRDVNHLVFPFDFRAGKWHMFRVFLRYFPRTVPAALIRMQKLLISANFISLLAKNFGLSKAEIKKRLHTVEHHVAHTLAAFYISGFDSAALLSVDGCGEAATTLLGAAEGNTFTKLKEVFFPFSVGLMYNTVTQFLGFRIDHGEGKVMGLAPYGSPRRYRDEFRKIIQPSSDGLYRMDMRYFRYHYDPDKKRPFYSKKFVKIFGAPRVPESALTGRDNDLAAALQEATEDIAVHLAKHLFELTKKKKLCIGGGVALNSVMNYRILQETPFEEVFIYPASNDAGTAIGAALFVYFNRLGNPKRPVNHSAYLGPSYGDEECEKALRQFNLSYRKFSSAAETTRHAATCLSRGKIIGWFQGRMEIGPRALGNRSIICQPYPESMKAVLNDRVKHREGFRPFAPSAKVERYREFFDIDTPSPYMLLVCGTRKDRIGQLAAITHVDSTARLQTVSREGNPVYWQLIDEYEKITGIPVILNTSFNVRGEPIVCTPADAVRCYLGTHMDMLFVNNYMVEKSPSV